MNSDVFKRLREGMWSENGGSKEIKTKKLSLNNGIPENLHRAEVDAEVDDIRIRAGERLSFDVSVRNRSGSGWAEGGRPIVAGSQLRSVAGRMVADVWCGRVSHAGKAPGATETLRFEAETAAPPPGEHRSGIARVEEVRRWFHQWGSAPFVRSLVIAS